MLKHDIILLPHLGYLFVSGGRFPSQLSALSAGMAPKGNCSKAPVAARSPLALDPLSPPLSPLTRVNVNQPSFRPFPPPMKASYLLCPFPI